MKAINIEISKLNNNNGQIKDVPKNPRFLRDAKFEKLKKSIQDFPEMLAYREIVCYDNDGEYVVIGGNMRLRACKDLGYKEVPCKIFPASTDAKRLREFVIKDNYGFGENDMDMLANEWDELELIDFCFDEIELGMDVADYSGKNQEIDVNEFGDKMILKFELSESDYTAVKSKLQMIDNNLNKALMDLINGRE